ncbi:MAG: hypothetical protein ACTSUO_04205, partial [Candidatus Thorarchaeota archaeon]
ASPEENPHLKMKAKKGKRAMSATERRFKDSNIAHLRITAGKAEAIDQYYTIENEDGTKVNVQYYSPEGRRVVPEVSAGAQDLYEWKDGKKVRIG